MSRRIRPLLLLASATVMSPWAHAALAQDLSDPNALAAVCFGGSGTKCVSVSTPSTPAPTTPAWMSTDVAAAWKAGDKGQGVTITMVDDFSSSSRFSGNFGVGVQTQRHGEWTREEASMIAPSATIVSKDFNTPNAVPLARGLNVLNLSYAMYARAGYSASQIGWDAEETSIIADATRGAAVISKAAGNDSVAVGTRNSSGQVDYLDLALIGTQSAIFVGALNSNGSPTSKATMAYYSDIAGTNPLVESHFLVVGVNGNVTGLLGTSFAAPIITGYSAILGSKFTTATPTQIANRLLTTARTDTLAGYSRSVYGMGEASLSNALAPNSIQ